MEINAVPVMQWVALNRLVGEKVTIGMVTPAVTQRSTLWFVGTERV